MREPAKILQIGNFPPPMCGWAIQLKLVTEELRRRGHICEVLKINEGRQIKSPEYIDVQDGADYLRKIWSYAGRGYRLNVHVNGMSKKGYGLALAAVLTGRILARPALITFHGGLSQDYFPRHDNSIAHWAFYALFALAGAIACDSQPIKEAIKGYGIASSKIETIATFSPQYLTFSSVALPDEVEEFFRRRRPVIVSYLSFRREYRLDTLREGMKLYRREQPATGFVWLGFPREGNAGRETVCSRLAGRGKSQPAVAGKSDARPVSHAAEPLLHLLADSGMRRRGCIGVGVGGAGRAGRGQRERAPAGGRGRLQRY